MFCFYSSYSSGLTNCSAVNTYSSEPQDNSNRQKKKERKQHKKGQVYTKGTPRCCLLYRRQLLLCKTLPEVFYASSTQKRVCFSGSFSGWSEVQRAPLVRGMEQVPSSFLPWGTCKGFSLSQGDSSCSVPRSVTPDLISCDPSDEGVL